MKVIMDIVTNHTADVIQYRECGVSGDLASGDASQTCPYHSLAQYPYTTRGGIHGEPINPGLDRKSVVAGKRVSVRVDLGGRRMNQKKTHSGRTGNRI